MMIKKSKEFFRKPKKNFFSFVCNPPSTTRSNYIETFAALFQRLLPSILPILRVQSPFDLVSFLY